MKFNWAKLFLMIFSFSVSLSCFSMERYEISCKDFDCLKNGWSMGQPQRSYYLNTVCKHGDCTKYGWFARDNKGNSYDVNCVNNACFTEGWTSVNLWQGRTYLDRATCKGRDCLVYGWNVQTGYDLFGGDVTCGNFDCATNGGVSYWRNRASKTVCYNSDCYHQGWSLFIY